MDQQAKAPSRRIFGLEISPQTYGEILDEVLLPTPPGAGPQMLATVNVDHVVNLRKNPLFREAYATAWKVTIDGAPVLAYAKAVGAGAPERVTGADLFDSLLSRWNPKSHRLFFLISSEEAAAAVTDRLLACGFDRTAIDQVVPPFGFEKDAAYSAELAERIRDFGATHLIMAVGAPKSEIWIYRHRELLGDLKVLCVGAAVEFSVGLKARAPKWMRATGLEWFHRFATEPRRLFRRYFIDSLGFVGAVIADRRNGGLHV